jgi:2-polyprenyl-6-methoxyphenol hydroxylase-like FAD-dependent oxidoreductase
MGARKLFDKKISIIGAGIGGLTAALLCHARGISCTVFEQAPVIREIGVGINLLPHAVKILHELGLLGALDDAAIRTEELIYANRFGQAIWKEPRGVSAGYDVPQFSIHRGRLQGLLLAAVQERLGSVVRSGHRLTDLTQNDDSIEAQFETSEGRKSISSNALIAADGIHSFVRGVLFPPQPPRWAGIIIWRGAAPWPRFLTGRSMIVAGGMQEKVVVYPIAPGPDPDRPLTNWAVNVRVAPEGAPLPLSEDWSRLGERKEMMRYVDRFDLGVIDVKALIESTGQFWEYPMSDRDPLASWTVGRVTLLGDAAHPMYPVGSNGAGQAILDAECLTRFLAHSDPREAFEAYQSERIPMTTEIITTNRHGGPERVIDEIERRSQQRFQSIDDILSFTERERIVRGYASIAGFSQSHVNVTSEHG